MKRVSTLFLFIAATPPLVLALLALLGARAHVGVVTTGTGDHFALGAAWVSAWLASMIVSPIAAVAALLMRLTARLTPPSPNINRHPRRE